MDYTRLSEKQQRAFRNVTAMQGIALVLVPIVLAVIGLYPVVMYGVASYGAFSTIVGASIVLMANHGMKPGHPDSYSGHDYATAALLSFAVVGIVIVSIVYAALGSMFAVGVVISIVLSLVVGSIGSIYRKTIGATYPYEKK